MVELYLIRHGKTYGNTLGRYIGTTDERLCQEGIAELKRCRYPQVEAVFASPMRRCRETAELLWPEREIRCISSLQECDFGVFENKNYLELKENPDYQAWVDSGGRMAFPGGERREDFQARCRKGFREVLEAVKQLGVRRAALVVHGGTIMSILEAYAWPHQEFYDWQAKNGGGYRACWKGQNKEEIRLYEVEPVGPDAGLCAGSDLR